ncbi:hypothetical protein [Desulfosporosinus youngiae]|uniref:SH3 domain-containing protein n=1 Tax=Desulfosporosinus youngiae DSM 17734 TaxID=768710 RepID=H5Y5G2_9FIRM|nr:hypothetical protein [Desulfosporosinus youngiae]EHQ90412.1 hypothetical protein DesyoDRAFT_3388 [Desulfosporosinus youngiae DSM 17734]
MRKLLRILFFILIIVVLNTGCSNQLDLKSKIESLENENADLRSKLEQVDSLSMAYQDYKDKQRFVAKESLIHALPIQNYKIIRPIAANTVIQVLDAAQCQDQRLWLHVSVPVYDSPINYKGWIPESETVRLTENNIKLVQGDLFIKEGTPIYEVDQYNQIESTVSTKISHDVRGRIEKRQDSYVYFMSPGGWYFWVQEKYLIFPVLE